MTSMRKPRAARPKQPRARNTLRYSHLTARQRVTYERALTLLSDLRRGEGSYGELLRKHRLSTRTAHKYLGRDLLGGTRGKPARASKSDRRVRDLMFPKSYGDIRIRTRNSRDASKLSEYFQDRDKLLRDKMSAADFETKWRGAHVAGEELFADVSVILGMADADILKLDHLYASTGGGR